MKFVKFLKSKTILSNSWVLLLGNGLITLLNFVFLSVLSHNLPQATYGSLREIFLILNLLITAGAAGFAQTLFYFLNENEIQNNKLNVIAQVRYLIIVLQLLLAIIIAIVFLSNPLLYTHVTTKDILNIFIYVFFSAITIVDINLAIVFNKSLSLIISNVFWLLIKLIILIIFLNNGISLGFVLLLGAVTQVIVFINNQFIIGKNYWGKLSEFKLLKSNTIIKILKYNIPLGLSTLIGFLILNTDRFILYLNNVNTVKFATLSNVAFEVPFIANIYGAFFTMALPVMIKSYQKNDINSFLQARFNYTKNVAILVFPVVVCFMVWHSEFINFTFGQNYNKLSYLFFLYSLISLLRFCSHHDVLLATQNTKYIFYLQVVELLFHLIVSIILYRYFDIYGLIYASVITNYTYMISVNFLSAHLIGVSIKNIFPYYFLVKQLLICFAAAFSVKYIFEPIVGNNLWYISVFIYGVVILGFHFFKLNKPNKLINYS